MGTYSKNASSAADIKVLSYISEIFGNTFFRNPSPLPQSLILNVSGWGIRRRRESKNAYWYPRLSFPDETVRRELRSGPNETGSMVRILKMTPARFEPMTFSKRVRRFTQLTKREDESAR